MQISYENFMASEQLPNLRQQHKLSSNNVGNNINIV